MKKFFWEIITIFFGNKNSGLVEKEEVEKKALHLTGCKCDNIYDQKIVRAQQMSLKEAFELYAPLFGGYTIEADENVDEVKYIFSYEKDNINIDFTIRISSNEMFYKSACIKCETCLGWKFHPGHRYSRFGEFQSVETPKEKVMEIIQEGEDISLKQYKQKTLAKKICGVK